MTVKGKFYVVLDENNETLSRGEILDASRKEAFQVNEIAWERNQKTQVRTLALNQSSRVLYFDKRDDIQIENLLPNLQRYGMTFTIPAIGRK